MAAYTRAASSAVAAIGPRWATLQHSGTAPSSLTRPKVGFNPTTPQNAAGIRIDPPPSAPMAAGQRPAATAAADPLELPPASCSKLYGFRTIPWCGLRSEERRVGKEC